MVDAAKATAAAVLIFTLLLVKYGKGFVVNISVLPGIAAGCAVAIAMGKIHFDKLDKAHWFDMVTPFALGMPIFDIVVILTMTLVMIVVMIESTSKFLALSDITGKKISQSELATGIRILSSVDYEGNRHSLYIVALSVGFGLVPVVAPR